MTDKVVGYLTTTSKKSDVAAIPPMAKGVKYLTSYNENPIRYSKNPYKESELLYDEICQIFNLLYNEICQIFDGHIKRGVFGYLIGLSRISNVFILLLDIRRSATKV